MAETAAPEIDALALVAKLQECKKSEVFELLEQFGITYKRGRRSSEDFQAFDERLVLILGEHSDGLPSKVLQFFLSKEGFDDITSQQFHSRLQSLQKQEKIAFNKATGLYGVTGKR